MAETLQGRDDDAEMRELGRKAAAAFKAGWERLCILECGQPFNGETCPRCWPPKSDDVDNTGIVWGLAPKQVYQWICIRLGATQTPGDQRRWMAVREALTIAIKESDYAHGRGPTLSVRADGGKE